MRYIFLTLFLFCVLAMGGCITSVSIRSVQFDRNCGGYLSRAATANTIELATPALHRAIEYAERAGLTNGYTSIFYQTPDEDIGFWYQNLKHAESELNSIAPDSTPLERSNILMKLRESLMLHNSGGESLICPSGLSAYPYNALYFYLGWGLVILAIILGLGTLAIWDN